MHCEELPGQAYLDPDLWERIVLNLVSNAFKVTLSGEIDVGLRASPGGFTAVGGRYRSGHRAAGAGAGVRAVLPGSDHARA